MSPATYPDPFDTNGDFGTTLRVADADGDERERSAARVLEICHRRGGDLSDLVEVLGALGLLDTYVGCRAAGLDRASARAAASTAKEAS